MADIRMDAAAGTSTAQGDIAPAGPATDRFLRLKEALRKRVTKHQYATWIQPMRLVSWDGQEIVVGLPNRFYQEWFHRNFRALVQDGVEEVTAGRMQRMLLLREDWRCPVPVSVEGLEPCRALLGAEP